MSQMTEISVEPQKSGVKLIRISGDLDAMGSQVIENPFVRAIGERNAKVVVDLSDVGFISSSGMALLLVKGKTLRSGGGDLCVASPNARVLEVFALAGFHEIFDVYQTVEEALAAMT
jgi:anti-anti-sigma factor